MTGHHGEHPIRGLSGDGRTIRVIFLQPCRQGGDQLLHIVLGEKGRHAADGGGRGPYDAQLKSPSREQRGVLLDKGKIAGRKLHLNGKEQWLQTPFLVAPFQFEFFKEYALMRRMGIRHYKSLMVDRNNVDIVQ